MKRKILEETGIKKECQSQRKEVTKNTISKDADHKQAIWDMYAYYGEPSATFFNHYFDKSKSKKDNHCVTRDDQCFNEKED